MKYFLALFLLLSITGVKAQTNKGSRLIGGNANIRLENQFGGKFWSTSLNPDFGYFVARNIAIGIVPTFQSRSYLQSGIIKNYSSTYNYSVLNYGLGPFFRAYIGAGKWKPFFHIQPGVARSILKESNWYYYGQNRTTITSGYVTGGLGISYFVSEYIGIEALLNATINDYAANIPPTSIGLYFGIQFHLPKKEKQD